MRVCVCMCASSSTNQQAPCSSRLYYVFSTFAVEVCANWTHASVVKQMSYAGYGTHTPSRTKESERERTETESKIFSVNIPCQFVSVCWRRCTEKWMNWIWKKKKTKSNYNCMNVYELEYCILAFVEWDAWREKNDNKKRGCYDISIRWAPATVLQTDSVARHSWAVSWMRVQHTIHAPQC